MNKGFELLTFNHAGAMLLKNGTTANYGVIRIENNELVYFTGKGLREIWAPNMSEEERKQAEELRKLYRGVDEESEKEGEKQLIKTQHIAITPLDEIERILF